MEQGNGMGVGGVGQTSDRSINRNLLRNGRLGIQKFKEQDQRTSNQFNSQAIYIVISGTVYSENTPGSTLLVSFHANKFWHFIKDLSDAYIFLFQLSITWDNQHMISQKSKLPQGTNFKFKIQTRQTHRNTLIICNWTPSSVWGPWKQLQMVSTILSISRFPGAPLSGALPVMCPYAMSF